MFTQSYAAESAPVAVAVETRPQELIDDVPEYVTRVIAGEVVSIPRRMVSIGEHGEITIPLIKSNW